MTGRVPGDRRQVGYASAGTRASRLAKADSLSLAIRLTHRVAVVPQLTEALPAPRAAWAYIPLAYAVTGSMVPPARN
jgi:hypothetical protein